MREPSLDELLDLVGLAYDGAVSPAGWGPLLEGATRVFEGSATVLFVHDVRGRVEYSVDWGLPADAMDEYKRDFAVVDVARDTTLALPPGTIVTDASTPADVYGRSEILNAWRAPWDIARYIGCDLQRDTRRLVGFAVQASARRAPFGACEAALLERLAPHLRRAIAMQLHLGRLDGLSRGFEDAIDGLVVGVVLLGERGEVLFTNASALRITQRNDGLAIEGGRLRAHLGDDDRALAKAIAGAIETTARASLAGGATVAVRRAWGEPAYAVLVNPVPRSDTPHLHPSAAAIVLIGDPDAALVSAEELAARLYGLTPSEARVAVALASGYSLETYADEHQIALSTVRWTLKKVLGKTGVRRQADLVRLMLTGPVAFGTDRSRPA